MWTRLFDQTMQRFVRIGALEITYPDGAVRHYGAASETPIRLSFSDPDMPRKIMLSPDLALGEAYTDGTLRIAQDDLRGFLDLAVRNRVAGNDHAILRMRQRIAAPFQTFFARNPLWRSRRNVAHHYDLSSELYSLFLDADRQYSCAYFADPGMSLEDAQEAKKRHIAGKLCLRPDHRVLDIGCGWGGMALTLARDYGARVVGVTLSEEQHRIATDRVARAGLADRIEIRLQDYRHVTETFDRIVSVGMFEHVGAHHYDDYFAKVRDRLAPDGIALIHTIGTLTAPRATSPWMRRYIFPGGYLPAMSQATASVERSQLRITDVEVLRRHYALTLREWSRRFEARIEDVRKLYDDRFCRMWRYYLTISELSFTAENLAVFQFQLARDKLSVPLTRDYLYA